MSDAEKTEVRKRILAAIDYIGFTTKSVSADTRDTLDEALHELRQALAAMSGNQYNQTQHEGPDSEHHP